MERENKEKILEMIKEIENKNLYIEEYISNLSILSRKDILKEITQDIINNNLLLQEIVGTKENIISRNKKEKNNSFNQLIEVYLNKIQEIPHKNIIFLIEFLDLFKEQISEKDKDVILKSLKDEKNQDKLRERMVSLANIFNLRL